MRLAVYAGTFDPVTRGHLSVIERAARLFDGLLVVIAVNPLKTPLFTVDERLAFLRDATRAWPTVECTATDGLIVELARARGATSLIRGVRGVTDVEAELELARQNHELAPEVETVFVPAHAHLSEVSSSALKRLAAQGADLSAYCTPRVAEALSTRFGVVHVEVTP
jgi:pantetheine-phosphate adenylyltransferase